MNYQLRSRVGQQQPTDLLEEVHDPNHLKKIKDWVKASKSPQYMRNHSGLLSPETAEVLYTENAILNACERVKHMNFPEDDKAKKKSTIPLDTSTQAQPEQTRVMSNPSTPGRNLVMRPDTDLPDTLRIEFPEANCHFLVCGQSLAAVQKEIQENLRALGRLAEEQVTLLHHGHPSGSINTPTVIVSDSIFKRMCHSGWFEIKLAPLTPVMQQARVSSPAASEDIKPRRQLDFEVEADTTHRRQRHVSYERTVREALKTGLVSALKDTTGLIVGKNLEDMLKTTVVIEKEWARVSREADEADGVLLSKRLTWYIEACINCFEMAMKMLWEALPVEAKLPHSYGSLQAFLAKLFRTVIPANQILKPVDFMDSLQCKFPPKHVTSLEQMMAEIAELSQQAITLDRLLGENQPELIEQAEKRLWCKILSSAAQDQIADKLQAAKCQVSSHSVYQEYETPPVAAYQLKDILKVLRGRSSRQTPWKDDFKWSPDKLSGKDKSTKAIPGAPFTPRENKPRILSVQGVAYTFPYHLQEESDHFKQKELEKQFVTCTVVPTVKCTCCSLPGHKTLVCPKFFKLDDKGVERNNRSFFFGLHPPTAILKLASQPSSVMTVAQMTGTAGDAETTSPQALPPDLAAVIRAAVQEAMQAAKATEQLNGGAGAAQ